MLKRLFDAAKRLLSSTPAPVGGSTQPAPSATTKRKRQRTTTKPAREPSQREREPGTFEPHAVPLPDASVLEQRRQGSATVLHDPVSGIGRKATREEYVRQRWLHHLLVEHRIARGSIKVEHYIRPRKGRSVGRADIVLFNGKQALMVIECKEPNTPLGTAVYDQALRYAVALKAPYFALTDGDDTSTFQLDGNDFELVEGFPTFDEMLARKKLTRKDPPSRDFAPLTLAQLRDKSFLDALDEQRRIDWGHWLIGIDTPPALKPGIFSLYSAIFHQHDKPRTLDWERNGFHVKEYRGLYDTEYGNYAGGRFNGLYATFLVKDSRGNEHFYKIGFFALGRFENDPTYATRRGTSALFVAIDDLELGHHSALELCLDKYLVEKPGKWVLTHSGVITVGRLGGGAKDDLLRFVEEREPSLVVDGRVMLGKFPADCAVSMDDIRDIVFNLLRYAELRDAFRIEYKQVKKLKVKKPKAASRRPRATVI